LEPLLNTAVKKAAAAKEKKATSTKRPLITLKNYAWDQSDKFVKIYLTNLSGVQSLPADQLSLTSQNNQHVLHIQDLKGKDYQFTTPKLLNDIEKVHFKQKEDMVLLMYKKVSPGVKWDCLTEKEKAVK